MNNNGIDRFFVCCEYGKALTCSSTTSTMSRNMMKIAGRNTDQSDRLCSSLLQFTRALVILYISKIKLISYTPF